MEMEPQQRTLTDLPFEVLDRIFKALACRPLYSYRDYTVYDYSDDKLSLAKTSEYLGLAFAYHSRGIYKKAMYDSSYRLIPAEAWPVILSLCGSSVVEYKACPGCCWSAIVAQAVAKYCPNLEKVTCQVYQNNGDLLLSVIDNAKNAIRILKFGYCFSDRLKIGAKIMHKIPELPLLKKLEVGYCMVDEAYEIQRFLNIEELNLYAPSPYYGEDPKALNLFKVCAPLKKLRLLTAGSIHIISETDENEPIPSFDVLEKITLNSSVISMELPSCPKLKSLEIRCSKCRMDGLICRSVLKQGEDLERLIVDSRPSQFNNDSLLEVIRTFRKLRYLDIPIRKIKFHREFVIELVNALRENNITPADPMEFLFDEITKIDWLHHWLSYTSSSNLINLHRY